MHEVGKQKNKKQFFGLIALILAGEAVFLLPYVIARVFRPVMLEVFGFTHTELGMAMAVYGITAIFAYLFGGPFADKYQPRKLIAISLVFTACGGLYMWSIPNLTGMKYLFGFWGVSTILLFWSALIKATRVYGGANGQGSAFGILDSGRGLISALIATFSVALFSFFMPEDVAAASGNEKHQAFQSVILFITGFVFFIALFSWFVLPNTKVIARKEHEKFHLSIIGDIIKMPSVWLQAIIIVCAYVGYKSVNNFAQYASDILTFDDVQAASVGALALWLRPVAALFAGFLADKVKPSKLMLVSFGLIVFGTVCLAAGIIQDAMIVLFFVSVIACCIGIFSMRSLYFTIMKESKIPLAFTGTVVGLVSVIGYTPDIFMYPLQGILLDNNPGLLGHQLFFGMVGAFATIGIIASILFIASVKYQTKTS